MGYQPISKFSLGQFAAVKMEEKFRKPVTFYDRVEFIGKDSKITITGGVITGQTLSVAVDIYSENWVSGGGTVPLSLPDAGATTGYAMDYSSGIGQFQALYTTGGQLGAEFVTISDYILMAAGTSEIVFEAATEASNTSDAELRQGYSGATGNYIELVSHVTTSMASMSVGMFSDVFRITNGTSVVSGSVLLDLSRIGSLDLYGSGSQLRLYSRDNDDQPSLWYNDTGYRMIFYTNGTSRMALVDAKIAIEQEAWVAPTLTNSWVNFGGQHQTARYRMTKEGVVQIQGLVKNGSAATAAIFTLPAEYRPLKELMFASISSPGTSCEIRVRTTGVIDVTAGGSTTYTSITLSYQL